jgi:aspartate aminotransferase-like enzyme
MEKRRILMTPGPTEISERVIRAMVRPSIYHIDPEFNLGVLEETFELLKRIFQTRNEVVAVPGSGRVALEASIVSAIDEGDKVLCVEAGAFGPWMTEMVRRVGGIAVPFQVEWGKPIDLSKLEEVISKGDFKALTIVHNETSTGAMYPIDKIGEIAKKYDLLYFVDTVSSLGGVDVRTDEWNIDFNMTASHKCLGAPIGLSIISISNKGWAKMENRKKPAASFSFDLLKWKKWWIPKERGGEVVFGWRRQPITMPVHLVYALKEAASIIIEEGLEKRFNRHKVASIALREAIRAIGLKIVADEDVASYTVTGIFMPNGLSESQVRRYMLENYGVMLAGGLGQLSGKIIRIGHMAMTASPEYIIPTIAALEDALSRTRYKFRRGVGLEKAEEMFEKLKN